MMQSWAMGAPTRGALAGGDGELCDAGAPTRGALAAGIFIIFV